MSRSARLLVVLASASLLIATIVGAYASHGMQTAAPQAVDAVRTAVAFQFYHGLALLAAPLLGERLHGRLVVTAGWLFVAGTLLFCGGIYTSRLLGLDALSGIAPVGGVAFMLGWGLIGTAAALSLRRGGHGGHGGHGGQ